MLRIIISIALLWASLNLAAQCEFPRNAGTRMYQNAIKYEGLLTYYYGANGKAVVLIDPSKLGFNRNVYSGQTVPPGGEWLIKWNWAPNEYSFRPVPVRCNTSAIQVDYYTGGYVGGGYVEVDFHYIDKDGGVSASFLGTLQVHIPRFTKDKIGKTFGVIPVAHVPFTP